PTNPNSPISPSTQPIPHTIYPKNKSTNIKTNLKKNLKKLLIKLLKNNFDIFALKTADMPDIDPRLIYHKLTIYPKSRPVQQKRKKLKPERSQTVKKQIQTLLKTEFIKKIKYPL
ncbi:hypothetical protein DF186_14100, partial [Enterococcus hirae]